MTNVTKTIDLEQLATVSGGTAAETAELKEAILANPAMAKIWQRKSERYGFDDAQTCHMVLMEACGVLNANCTDPEANSYSVVVDGVEKYKLNHSEVLSLIKGYREI